ncbi:hypothetical protein MOSE0_N12002 [Monosporozyma servazzii]
MSRNDKKPNQSYNLVFDKIWFKLTSSTPTDEYIQGSKFIDLVKEMNNLSDNHIITDEQIQSASNFSMENPESKIYRFNIDTFLTNILGFTFNQYLERINLHHDVEEINGNREKSEQVYHKDTNKFQEELDNYKARYDTLRKEFEHYKNKQTSNRHEALLHEDMSVDYDVIIDEFKNQIKEQRELMLNISQNIEKSIGYNDTTNLINNNNMKCVAGGKDKTNTQAHYQLLRKCKHIAYQMSKIAMIVVVSIIIYFLISKHYTTYPIQMYDDEEDNDMNNMLNPSFDIEPWWTQYSTLSEWIYKIQDWFNDLSLNQWNTKNNNDNNNMTFDRVHSDSTNDPFSEIRY